MKQNFYIFFLALLCISASEDNTGNGYSVDFSILVQSLKELHPALYKNINMAKFDSEVKEIEERLLHITEKNKAEYIIQEFIFHLGDLHASIIDAFRIKPDKILPFKVYIVGKELYIKSYESDSSFNGAKIISIDGTSSRAIIDSLRIFYSNDGARDISSFGLQSRFNNFYSAFCSQRDTFNLLTSNGVLIAPAVKKGDAGYEKLSRYSEGEYMQTDNASFKSTIEKDYGYFRFRSFDKKYDGNNIKKEFENFITLLNKKQVQNAVIDLRYNEGGSPYMAGEMAAYFSEKPFRIFENVFVTPVKIPTYIKNMSESLKYHFRLRGTITSGDQLKKVSAEEGLKECTPKKNGYKGTVYIVTGDMTESAATMFCSFLKGQKNVVFVGSETGGAINYFWAHRHCMLTLPNSGIQVTFPMELLELKKGSSEIETPVGMIPQNNINYNIEDLLNGTDKEMEWIKNDIVLKAAK